MIIQNNNPRILRDMIYLRMDFTDGRFWTHFKHSNTSFDMNPQGRRLRNKLKSPRGFFTLLPAITVQDVPEAQNYPFYKDNYSKM